MKTIIRTALVAIIVMSAVVLFAQPGHGGKGTMATPDQMAKMMTEKMTKELSLSDKQVKEVQAINLKMATERAEARKVESKSGDQIQKRTQMMNKHIEQLKKVLSPEQMQKWSESRAAMSKSHGQHGGHKHAMNKSDDCCSAKEATCKKECTKESKGECKTCKDKKAKQGKPKSK